jgi:hypothetical protein
MFKIKIITSTPSTRSARGKQGSVTEVVDPIAPQVEEEESEAADLPTGHGGCVKGQRLSFASRASATSEMTNAKSDCSLIGKSESGQREDEETSRKFGSVFSLSEKEVLIDRESQFQGFYSDSRLPWISLPLFTRLGAILRIHKLLLLPLIAAPPQDRSELPNNALRGVRLAEMHR